MGPWWHNAPLCHRSNKEEGAPTGHVPVVISSRLCRELGALSLRIGLQWPLCGLSAGVVLMAGLSRCHATRLCSRGGFSMQRSFWLILLMMLVTGEAANPGPAHGDDSAEWVIGVANPTGLSKKLDMTAHMSGHTWVISETHLTAATSESFKKGLKALRSPFTGVVTGAPCAPRKSENSGEYSGVMLLNRGAARALIHAFDSKSYATGRMQAVGFMANNTWIQAGILYGVPKSGKRQAPDYQTDALLEQLVDRIACSTVGPRLIAGDLNHSEAQLTQLRRLRSLGFREVQEIASYRWGQQERPTGRGSVKLDQIWLSPELVGTVTQVVVRNDRWSDHATVEATLHLGANGHRIDRWHMPKPFPWPSDWEVDVTWDRTVEATQQYASFWQEIENAAVQHAKTNNVPWTPAQTGRGQTLETRSSLPASAPLKPSRSGEVVPVFLGNDMPNGFGNCVDCRRF